VRGTGIRGFAWQRQVPIHVNYKGLVVAAGELDIPVESRLVIELKSVDTLAPVHCAQLLSYLKATGHRVGLLINFNVPLLKQGLRRLVHSPRAVEDAPS
jgi:GxxExxY protein